MPNVGALNDSLSQIITSYQTESQKEILFSHKAFKYAYSHLNFYPDTAKHSIFTIVSGDMTGT